MEEETKTAVRRSRLIAWTVIGLSAAALIIGILRGEAAEIYRKGINICLSCIGIG